MGGRCNSCTGVASSPTLVSRTSAASALARAARAPGPSARSAKRNIETNPLHKSCGPWIPALALARSAGTREHPRGASSRHPTALPHRPHPARATGTQPPQLQRQLRRWLPLAGDAPAAVGLLLLDPLGRIAVAENVPLARRHRPSFGHACRSARRLARLGSPPEFHARRPRPAARGGRRIDRRRHCTGAGVRRLCACTRATAPGRREPRTTAARRGAAPPRSAAARPARGSWAWS